MACSEGCASGGCQTSEGPTQDVSASTQDSFQKCKKCANNANVVIDKVHKYCPECFLSACHKKFRSSMGKAQITEANDVVLVSNSGGPSSAMLLDLLHDCVDSDNPSQGPKQHRITRKNHSFNFHPVIFHVHCGVLASSGSNSDLVEILRHISEHYPNWPVVWTKLEFATLISSSCNIFYLFDKSKSDGDNISDSLRNDMVAKDNFMDTLNRIDNLTDKIEQVRHTLDELTLHVGRSLLEKYPELIPITRGRKSNNCDAIMTASTSSQLATTMMIDVVLGQGQYVNSLVSMCDRRSDIPIIRPMRDFSKKEVIFYNRFKQLISFMRANLLTKTDQRSSIQLATETFLSKLFVDYPATYNTLLHTGTKIKQSASS